ncbi:hypothetical protein EAD96_29180 [Micromonospora sp. BL1]|nr:hypothetical protein EAD96_29180 [Micromonospora sp. BL1]
MLPVVAVKRLAGDGGDERGGGVGVVVSAVDAGAAVGGEEIAGQGEYGGEADPVRSTFRSKAVFTAKRTRALWTVRRDPEFLVGQLRGLSA